MGLPHIQKELVAHLERELTDKIDVWLNACELLKENIFAETEIELVFLVHAHREEKHLQGGQNAQKDQKDFQVFAFIPDHGAPPLDFPRVRR